MKRHVQLVLAFVLGLMLGLPLYIYSGSRVIGIPEDGVIKTTWHTHIKLNPDEYVVLANDTVNDIAYYQCISHPLVDVGDTVIGYEAVQGKVTYVTTYGFAFMPDDPDYYKPGLSGTAIRNEDYVQIGIVSGQWSNGEVYCIWS